MPSNNVSAAELSRGWLKYIVDNDISDPTEEDIVAYLTDAGYEDLAVKKIVQDIQFTKHGQTKNKSATKTKKPKADVADDDADDSAVLDITDLTQAQTDMLNKIKDVIRMKMTSKQRIDLRRYLENE